MCSLRRVIVLTVLTRGVEKKTSICRCLRLWTELRQRRTDQWISRLRRQKPHNVSVSTLSTWRRGKLSPLHHVSVNSLLFCGRDIHARVSSNGGKLEYCTALSSPCVDPPVLLLWSMLQLLSTKVCGKVWNPRERKSLEGWSGTKPSAKPLLQFQGSEGEKRILLVLPYFFPEWWNIGLHRWGFAHPVACYLQLPTCLELCVPHMLCMHV